jgi:sarcosine oxidase subunit gamma
VAEFAFTLEAKPILGGVDRRLGENRIVERSDLAIVSIAWGLAWPDPTVSTVSGDVRAVRSAPDQLLLIFPHATPDANRVVQSKLNGAGYTTDQTDVWVMLEISGPATIAALERLCPLDVSRFPDGGAGRTVMEHMGALIIRVSAGHFYLLSASSSARSFLHAVETSYDWVMQ